MLDGVKKPQIGFTKKQNRKKKRQKKWNKQKNNKIWMFLRNQSICDVSSRSFTITNNLNNISSFKSIVFWNRIIKSYSRKLCIFALTKKKTMKKREISINFEFSIQFNSQIHTIFLIIVVSLVMKVWCVLELKRDL